MKIISSNTKNESYLGYLIIEIIMIAAITFLGAAFILFYSVGRSDTRRNTQNLEYLFDNPLIFGLICFIPSIFGVLCLLYYRNRNYVIGYLFNQADEYLTINYRSIFNKEVKEISIPYKEIVLRTFREKKILFNQAHTGKRIIIPEKNLVLDFVTNNFIWEKQPRERVHFLNEIEKINIAYAD